MRLLAIVTLCAAIGGCASALLFETGTQAVAAESASAWKDCQSTDENKRLVGCTSVIDAQGFGSLSKLADALDGRCWAHNVKQQFLQAINDCNASIRIRPRYSYAYNNLGTAYLGLQNYEKAIKALNIAIDLKPDFYWSRLNRAKALVAIGRNQSAAEDYQYLLRRDPTNQELIHSLDVLTVTVVQKPDVRLTDPISIRMEQEGGVYVVPVRFNDMITLSAIVDSGASDMSVPADVVLTLMRTKTITDQDFLGQQTYVLADGSKVPSQQFRIRSLKVGDKTVENVVASIASVNGEILLGQSFLNKFKSWSVDNERHTLILR
jgi:tetratricopeptide (TPR) repeat protein